MKRSFLLSILVSTSMMLVACGGAVSDAPGDGGTSDGGGDGGITTIDGGGVDTAEPPPIYDTGFKPDTSPPPPTDVGPPTCNDLANVGDVIDEMRIAAPLPTLAGAASIAPGTYVLVKNEIYTGSGGAGGKTGKTLRETLSISPGVVQASISQNGSPDHHTNTTYSIVGAALRAKGTCDDSSTTLGGADFAFDATATTLRIGLRVDGSTSFLLTFEKK